MRKLSLRRRRQNTWKAVGKHTLTPLTIHFRRSNSTVSLGMVLHLRQEPHPNYVALFVDDHPRVRQGDVVDPVNLFEDVFGLAMRVPAEALLDGVGNPLDRRLAVAQMRDASTSTGVGVVDGSNGGSGDEGDRAEASKEETDEGDENCY
ncbi:hypothetical protein QJS04_geneDACA017813 [Acorus gramineus]|uniref:Uncharacterized protein n=1 Tax=Acorus gramineus TaxID=55184 RepID=A0AAV9A3F9_ACOGR|nr:hypothetical protein QJS04_geneDACA017813 [Acorus gramineus]